MYDLRINCFLLYFLVISATPGGILDKAIEAEDKMHGDFLRLVIIVFHSCKNRICTSSHLPFLLCEQEHVEGYHQLSGKTKTYFSTVVSLWDAEFYVKVDDDIHVNLGKHDNPAFLHSGPVAQKKPIGKEKFLNS